MAPYIKISLASRLYRAKFKLIVITLAINTLSKVYTLRSDFRSSFFFYFLLTHFSHYCGAKKIRHKHDGGHLWSETVVGLLLAFLSRERNYLPLERRRQKQRRTLLHAAAFISEQCGCESAVKGGGDDTDGDRTGVEGVSTYRCSVKLLTLFTKVCNLC